MIAQGKNAPAFALPSHDGRTVSLADLRGRKVVLYFYPKDSTPGCSLEAQGFRDAAARLAKRNAVVLGVSKDSLASHCRFADKYQLEFPLLSDPDGKVIEAYGAWGEKVRFGKKARGIIRTTVIIDSAGKIARVFPNVKVAGHVDAVVEALEGVA